MISSRSREIWSVAHFSVAVTQVIHLVPILSSLLSLDYCHWPKPRPHSTLLNVFLTLLRVTLLTHPCNHNPTLPRVAIV